MCSILPKGALDVVESTKMSGRRRRPPRGERIHVKDSILSHPRESREAHEANKTKSVLITTILNIATSPNKTKEVLNKESNLITYVTAKLIEFATVSEEHINLLPSRSAASSGWYAHYSRAKQQSSFRATRAVLYVRLSARIIQGWAAFASEGAMCEQEA